MDQEPTVWQVEVSDGLKYIGDKDTAYREAEKLQSEGRNVEIYEDGRLVSRLR